MAPFTTLSTPLIVGDEVIGALTVSRQIPVPYDELDQRLIEAVALIVAPVLAGAQRESDGTRRQQGASELSRLAGSLTQSLSAEAVCERLVQARRLARARDRRGGLGPARPDRDPRCPSPRGSSGSRPTSGSAGS